MKTRFKAKSSKKIEFIPKYKVEKKYFPLFQNRNLRNNQNYVLGKSIMKKIFFYASHTFIWGSSIRLTSNKRLNIFLKNEVKALLIIILFTLLIPIGYVFEILPLVITGTFMGMFSLLFLYSLVVRYFFGSKKNILTIKDKNKYIILKKGKIK